MSEHETVRGLLALAAAGALDAEEQRRVERHARECEICRGEMETWGLYSAGLRKMPQPAVPAYLAARAQIRVLQDQEVRAEQARNSLVLLALSLFGWTVSFAFWLLLRLSTGGAMVVMQTNVLRLDLWALIWTVLVGSSGATAAIVLARRGREWRIAL